MIMRYSMTTVSSVMVMDVCCSGSNRFFNQGNFNSKARPFTEHAFHFDAPVMRINYSFYIAQPESKSFNVMKITGVCPVEFFKNSFYGFLRHSDAIVFKL